MSNLKQEYFVFYCCTTNYSNAQQLNTENIIISQFFSGQEFGHGLIGSLCYRVSHLPITVLSGLPPSQGLTGRRSTSKLMCVCGHRQALEGPLQAPSYGCQQSSSPQWLLASFLPHGPLHGAIHNIASLLLQSEGSEKTVREGQKDRGHQFLQPNLRSNITTHLPCSTTAQKQVTG